MAALILVAFPDEPAAFDITADPGFVAADDVNGDTFQNDGKTGLYVENPTGAAITVTVVGARKSDQGFLNDAVVSVPTLFKGFVATEFENNRFSDAAGLVSLTYSAIGLNVAAVRLP